MFVVWSALCMINSWMDEWHLHARLTDEEDLVSHPADAACRVAGDVECAVFGQE